MQSLKIVRYKILWDKWRRCQPSLKKTNDHCFMGCKSQEYFTWSALYHVLTCTLATTCSVLSTMRLLTKWPSLVYVFEVSVKRPRDEYIETIRLFAFDLYFWQLTRNRNVDLKRRLLGLINSWTEYWWLFLQRQQTYYIRYQRYQKALHKLKCKRFRQTLTAFKMELYLKRLALSGMQFNMI